MTANLAPIGVLPGWVPSAVRLYLTHTETGESLRAIARAEGVHASTVMRQVRKFENRRDDPLVDCALGRLTKAVTSAPRSGKTHTMALQKTKSGAAFAPMMPDDDTLQGEALRVLAQLSEPGAVLAVAPDMERAVVLREGAAGAERLAVLERPVAEAFALRDWIVCARPGRVSKYHLAPAGRAKLRQLQGGEPGGEEQCGQNPAVDPDDTRRTRPVTQETPVATLARRRDKSGKLFLTPGMVYAAERLREDFEIAHTEPGMSANWDQMLTGGAGRGTAKAGCDPMSRGAGAARARVEGALADLGPGLADMALRCCCRLEGLETAERELGWSARSGKIVLRIALIRLQRHYEAQGDAAKMIG